MHHYVYDEMVESFSLCCCAPCVSANVDITEFATLTKEGTLVEGHRKDFFIPLSVPPFPHGGQSKVALLKSRANASPVQPAAPGGTECRCYTHSV